ncbi:MAG: DUF362 domain-containing protein [Clostridia bacterium]|nr:DUF362 domain-containing protein [Clostridia bacterium]
MKPSKVYFTDFRADYRENLLQKLRRLCLTAGINEIDFNNKFTAIKLHFGEYGNLAFLRPNYARVVADLVKELGGKPFLTDCNTLYVGSRKNALDHLETAYANGFSPLSTGCQIIIGDGLKGTDEVEVPVQGEYLKSAKIGRAVMDADVFISLNHFKGHEMAGFGGALKNIGMGCGSRAGKMEMHNDGKPLVKETKCVSCRACAKICAHDAPQFATGKAVIDHQKCVGCGRCIGICPTDAIFATNDSSCDKMNIKIAEYSKAVLEGRPHFHISLICDVSPNCDCHSENDAPIIPNVGMLASFNPVALDQACADLCNQQPILKNSCLEHHHHDHETDRFHLNHPDTNWKVCVDHAEKIGIGTTQYELIPLPGTKHAPVMTPGDGAAQPSKERNK